MAASEERREEVKENMGEVRSCGGDGCCACCDHCGHEGEDDGPWRKVRLVVGAAVTLVAIGLFYLTELSVWVTLPMLVAAYVILGFDVLVSAVRNIFHGQVFDENFLMAVATLGAWGIGQYPEAVAVMLFYQVGEFFQDSAVGKTRRAIVTLMDIRPDEATVERGGQWMVVHPNEVRPDEIIVVKPGEKIALDGVVTDGDSMLDTKALTGESKPMHIHRGEIALSGSVNLSGALKLKVIKPFAESTASKIVELVENAGERKAPSEQFITKFARLYTPVVVGMAVLLAICPPLFWGGVWSEWIRRACVFLVISCPCALVISIPLTFFGGIGAASRRGVLVKGGNYLEALNHLDVVVFDKTGTLTKGDFEVVDVVAAEGFTPYDVLHAAAHAEMLSDHPIAKSILAAYRALPEAEDLSQYGLRDYMEISGHGTHVFSHDHLIYAGNARLMQDDQVAYVPCTEPGSHVYVARDNVFIGCIVIDDVIKPDSAHAVARLRELGVKKIMMLTGDEPEVAQKIASLAGIDSYRAGLLPARKVEAIEALSKDQDKIAFVGDGINDAPVLARADVGIAMGGIGSDAAIEASDVVLMTDEPSRIADAIEIARSTRRIVIQNIVFALGVKVLFLILGALGIVGLWPAVFADVGVMLLAVLNAARMIRH